jgi:glycerol-3-phosphate dehydrogenase
MNRESFLDRLAAESAPWDVLIVGGGATGLGAAVDAAARGYRVALIEQGDFAKGTSSRSTKLIHGGIRYLRQGRIGLVLDSLRERALLLRNAPHLVSRLDFVIPAYARWERPFYGLGVMLYEGLAREDAGGSRLLSRDATLRRLPTLRAEGLRGGVRYHDAQFDDARLAIELARTAADLGAVPVNYVRAERLLSRGGRVRGVVAVDVESGREIEIASRAVINATGVFADVLRGLDEPGTTALVAPSQGAHVVLPRSFLPGDAALLVPRTADGRVLFAVPWHEHVVVGTTDTPVERAELEPRPLAEEVRFILDHAARYLEHAPVLGDVRSVFAGLRPLVRASASRATSSISRDHAIEVSRSGLITITGGKWTTYRKMAEDVIDRAARVAGLEPRPSRTAELRLRGSTSEPCADARLAPYGADAAELAALERSSPELAERLDPEGRVSAAQVVWAVRHEMARTVEDVLARRTRLLILGAGASLAAAPAVARRMARERGLDEAWERRAVEEYRSIAVRYVP